MAESIEKSLEDKWAHLTAGIDVDVGKKWWDIITSKYSEPPRKYHTLSHLCKMFQHLDSNLEAIGSTKALSYAIFFHDLEYDVKSQSNEEESVKLFEKFSVESGIDKDEELTSHVKDLILLSKNHCTDAHITDNVYGNEDKHYFLDFDVSILGSDTKEYEEYAEQIREEYSYLPVEKYNFLRLKVLKLFLQIPNIFATKIFRDKYETKARENIEIEISRLNAEK